MGRSVVEEPSLNYSQVVLQTRKPAAVPSLQGRGMRWKVLYSTEMRERAGKRPCGRIPPDWEVDEDLPCDSPPQGCLSPFVSAGIAGHPTKAWVRQQISFAPRDRLETCSVARVP